MLCFHNFNGCDKFSFTQSLFCLSPQNQFIAKILESRLLLLVIIASTSILAIWPSVTPTYNMLFLSMSLFVTALLGISNHYLLISLSNIQTFSLYSISWDFTCIRCLLQINQLLIYIFGNRLCFNNFHQLFRRIWYPLWLYL